MAVVLLASCDEVRAGDGMSNPNPLESALAIEMPLSGSVFASDEYVPLVITCSGDVAWPKEYHLFYHLRSVGNQVPPVLIEHGGISSSPCPLLPQSATAHTPTLL